MITTTILTTTRQDDMLAGLGERIRVGVDRVEMADFRLILTTGGDKFLSTVYTNEERDYCDGRVDRLATRFAAKEAVSKALGTGLRGISFTEIEVVSEENGQPRLCLHGRARDRGHALGITSMSVSLTHTSVAAEAFVVALVRDVITDHHCERTTHCD